VSGTKPLAGYRHTVGVDRCSHPPSPDNPSFSSWLDGLPSLQAGSDLREIIARWTRARREGRPVIWGMGAHVIKAGLSPWVIALMERGLITRLALNGAGAIHDFELTAVGHTSEDVAGALAEGVFGQAEETARFINDGARDAAGRGIGLGAALVERIGTVPLAHPEVGLLAAAGRLGLPVTVHLAIGTDTAHSHPSADGASLGAATLSDFHSFSAAAAELEGGVYFNVGSAVLLPEIFLKAVSSARADGRTLAGMTTVVLDFIRHYRPLENVTRRPLGPDGRGYYLIGHHEIMIPLLAQAAFCRRAAP
jgi:hypothetical protein